MEPCRAWKGGDGGGSSRWKWGTITFLRYWLGMKLVGECWKVGLEKVCLFVS